MLEIGSKEASPEGEIDIIRLTRPSAFDRHENRRISIRNNHLTPIKRDILLPSGSTKLCINN